MRTVHDMREEARDCLAKARRTPDSASRRKLLLRALELALEAEAMERGMDPGEMASGGALQPGPGAAPKD